MLRSMKAANSTRTTTTATAMNSSVLPPFSVETFSGRGKRARKRVESPYTMANASMEVVILSTGSTRKPVLNTALIMPCPVWSR